jgi:hypothetical protein
MEPHELYPDFYDNEDEPEDPERLTVIDDYYFRIATGWQEVEEWENSSD